MTRVPAPLAVCFPLLSAAALILCTGCGSSTYEARLAETARYFSYLNNLNRQLTRRHWEGGGIAIRLPKELKELPKPEDNSQGLDRWLPGFFGTAADGIVGRFVTGEPNDPQACHVYILSNYNLWLSTEHAKLAPDFRHHALEQMQNAFNLPNSESQGLKTIELPLQAGYVEKQEFGTASLHPKQPVFGTDVDIEVFTHTNGDIEAVFVLIIPRDGDARVLDKFQLALETLKMESKKPSGSPDDEQKDSAGNRSSKKRKSAPQTPNF